MRGRGGGASGGENRLPVGQCWKGLDTRVVAVAEDGMATGAGAGWMPTGLETGFACCRVLEGPAVGR